MYVTNIEILLSFTIYTSDIKPKKLELVDEMKTFDVTIAHIYKLDT